jgi:glycogen debranching enzyme
MTPFEDLRVPAQRILQANDRGGYTIPSAKLYPHQWNWDSAFCAIGWAHIDPRRAARELQMLLRGQWDDGLIPHIIFNPEAAHYEPGPATWRTENAPGAPKAARASSITQPPIAATAARRVLARAGGDAEVETVLREVVLGLERWHRWFAVTRDPTNDGVPCIVHPWESGMDNAPRWDAAMKRIEPGVVEYKRKDDGIIEASQRPTRYDYDRYFFMVHERARHGFAPPRPETEPLLVQDVAMGAILCRAERDLAALARDLGVEASHAAERGDKLERAIQARLYDEGTANYHDYDVLGKAPILVDHVATMLPLFAGIAPPAAVDRIVEKLRDPTAYGASYPVPSVPLSSPELDTRRYWRGPSWINVNWMIIEGLRASGQNDAAASLTEKTLALLAKSGFFEYFDPRTGEGLGANDFSWSAALAIDLLAGG